jgi:hypothetical protein
VEIFSLTVRPTRRARIAVTCKPGCGKNVKRGRSKSFPRLAGKRLRAGSRLLVRVTRSDMLGSYLSFRITRGSFRDPVERCLIPGSSKPRRRCS